MTTPNIHTQVADVLAAARGLIEERGWVQGVLTGVNGECCLLKALDIAVPDGLWMPARNALADVVFGSQSPRDSIVDWNDDPTRTQAEVLAAFETAEANERRRAEA